MIFENIKKANVQAMKDKDVIARSIYSVVINKFMLETIKKREKDEALNEGEELNILQKTIKELEDEKENFSKAGNLDQVKVLEKQIEIVGSYLPKLLTEEEIKDIILNLEDKSIPSVMKHFKLNYNGKCDMRKVQEVLKGIQ